MSLDLLHRLARSVRSLDGLDLRTPAVGNERDRERDVIPIWRLTTMLGEQRR